MPKRTRETPSPASTGDDVEARVREQLEFYFSDANLRRDEHMRELLGPEAGLTGWADVSHLLSFAKMGRLLEGVESERRAGLVEAALRRSAALELAPDATRVRRRQPFAPVDDLCVAARTVYVEPVRADEDHDSLKAEFSACGKVSRVSLPRNTAGGGNTLRGFAFVEFDTPEAAAKACADLDSTPLDPAPGAPVRRVITRIEWAELRKRWNTLMYKPIASRRQAGPSKGPASKPTKARGRGTPVVPGKSRAPRD